MRTKTTTRRSMGYILLVAAVLAAASTGYSQWSHWQQSGDPLMVVIPVRSELVITSDLEIARANKQLAMDHHNQARERLVEIERAIEDREATIENVERREDDAKDEKRRSEAASLKIESKANKQAIDLLKRVKKLREAEMEVAKVEEEHADLTIRSYELESDLQNKRSDYNWPLPGDQGDLTQNTAYQVIGELEVNLLEMQQDMASSAQKVASKLKDVVNQRKNLHEAQFKLGM